MHNNLGAFPILLVCLSKKRTHHHLHHFIFFISNIRGSGKNWGRASWIQVQYISCNNDKDKERQANLRPNPQIRGKKNLDVQRNEIF
jgi:hypothetical protein